MAGRHTQVRPRQPPRAQKGQKQPRARVTPRVPPAEEEDPRVRRGLVLWGAWGWQLPETVSVDMAGSVPITDGSFSTEGTPAWGHAPQAGWSLGFPGNNLTS